MGLESFDHVTVPVTRTRTWPRAGPGGPPLAGPRPGPGGQTPTPSRTVTLPLALAPCQSLLSLIGTASVATIRILMVQLQRLAGSRLRRKAVSNVLVRFFNAGHFVVQR